MPQLSIPGATFYSAFDEALLFAWLESIPGVKGVVGQGRHLIVTLRSNRLSRASLTELLALHRRYEIPMRELARFKTEQNASWFADPRMYWHKAVFGKTRG